MSEADEAEAAAVRLESALDRLAALAARPRSAVANPAASADQASADHASADHASADHASADHASADHASADHASAGQDRVATGELASRLDGLIAELRGALAG